MRLGWLIGIGVFAALACASPAQADKTETGSSVRIDGARGSVLAVGASVEIGGDISPGLRPMTGVLAIGGSVKVTASIDGALAAAGGDVGFSGHVVRLMASGGNVVISGRVQEDAMIAGGNLTLTREASIDDELHAAGGSLEIEGAIGEKADLAGAFIRFDGVVGGDAELSAEKIVIGPNARVAGDLIYYSEEPAEISPQAQIAGEVIFKKPSQRDFEWRRAQHPPFARGDLRSRAYGALFWFVALGASGALMVLMFPRWMGETAAAGRDRPLTSLLVGFAVLVALPVAAILLMMTVLGIPFGGLLLTLYAGLMAVSMIGAGLAVGHLFLDRSAGRQAKFLQLFAGLAIVLVAGAAPLVGGIAGFFALIFGLGVLFRGLWASLRTEAV